MQQLRLRGRARALPGVCARGADARARMGRAPHPSVRASGPPQAQAALAQVPLQGQARGTAWCAVSMLLLRTGACPRCGGWARDWVCQGCGQHVAGCTCMVEDEV